MLKSWLTPVNLHPSLLNLIQHGANTLWGPRTLQKWKCMEFGPPFLHIRSMALKLGFFLPIFFSKQLTFNKGNTSVRSPEQCLFHSKDACHCFPNVVFWKPGGSRCISEPSFLRSSQAWRWISWQAGNVSGSWHLRNHHTRSDPAQIVLVLWAKCVESSATGDDSQAQSSNQGQH